MFVIDETVGDGRGMVWGCVNVHICVVFLLRASENGPAISLEQWMDGGM